MHELRTCLFRCMWKYNLQVQMKRRGNILFLWELQLPMQVGGCKNRS